jgi:hypothetical protein
MRGSASTTVKRGVCAVLSLRTQSGLQQRIVKLRLNRLNSKSPTRLVTPLFHNNELLSKPQDPSVELPFKGALTLRVEAKLRNSDLTRPTKRGTPAAAKNTPPTPPPSSNASRESSCTSRHEQCRNLFDESAQREAISNSVPAGATALGEIHRIMDDIHQVLVTSYVQEATTLQEIRDISRGVQQLLRLPENAGSQCKCPLRPEQATIHTRDVHPPLGLHSVPGRGQLYDDGFVPWVAQTDHGPMLMRSEVNSAFGRRHDFGTQTDAFPPDHHAGEENGTAADPPRLRFGHCAEWPIVDKYHTSK